MQGELRGPGDEGADGEGEAPPGQRRSPLADRARPLQIRAAGTAPGPLAARRSCRGAESVEALPSQRDRRRTNPPGIRPRHRDKRHRRRAGHHPTGRCQRARPLDSALGCKASKRLHGPWPGSAGSTGYSPKSSLGQFRAICADHADVSHRPNAGRTRRNDRQLARQLAPGQLGDDPRAQLAARLAAHARTSSERPEFPSDRALWGVAQLWSECRSGGALVWLGMPSCRRISWVRALVKFRGVARARLVFVAAISTSTAPSTRTAHR